MGDRCVVVVGGKPCEAAAWLHAAALGRGLCGEHARDGLILESFISASRQGWGSPARTGVAVFHVGGGVHLEFRKPEGGDPAAVSAGDDAAPPRVSFKDCTFSTGDGAAPLRVEPCLKSGCLAADEGHGREPCPRCALPSGHEGACATVVDADACRRCKGEGFMMADVPGFAGRQERVRCPDCNGAGARRCNAEARTGHLCKRAPGHDGRHTDASGEVRWESEKKKSGRSFVLQRFLEGPACWVEGRPPPNAPAERGFPVAGHSCGVVSDANPEGLPDFPAAVPDEGASYYAHCARDGWCDVTAIVVDNRVVPWVEHKKPAPKANGGGPERLGDILERGALRSPSPERRAIKILARLAEEIVAALDARREVRDAAAPPKA